MRKARTQKTLDKYEPKSNQSIEAYLPFIGPDRVAEILSLAKPLAGSSWAHVNSTFQGGGVAEMLRSIVPLARNLGIDTNWYAIRGNDEFFKVTKKFHNLLQGAYDEISLDEIFGSYLATIEENAKDTSIFADMIVVHDPQPAALVLKGTLFGHVLWRCHIDTSRPDQRIWDFLLPYINHCGGAIFTMPEFVGQGIQVPVYQVMPCIDPLAKKNRQYSDKEALKILGPLFHEHDVDPARPIIAAVSRYDMHKNQATILQAFKKLKKEKPMVPPPYLIFMGNTATDDPEGEAMLEQLREQADGDQDVRFWVNVEDNDRVVGALMRKADAFVHVSTREGFGLVVSEALWQGTPVIGSNVGGIKEQVIDRQTGLLVDPLDTDAVASAMANMVVDTQGARLLGARGREHVRRNFLLPEIIKRYLTLLRFHQGVDWMTPRFRLNGLSYGEFMGTLRAKHLQEKFSTLSSRAS
ncbi:MAG: glycosyltransferase [Planctomycetota bacterium]|jgi:trehalose synthase